VVVAAALVVGDGVGLGLGVLLGLALLNPSGLAGVAELLGALPLGLGAPPQALRLSKMPPTIADRQICCMTGCFISTS
jgi:hypothetical protein